MVKVEKLEKKFLLLLVLICLVFFLPLIKNPNLLAVKDNDLGRNYVPLYIYIQNSIKTYGVVPLWRPTQMMGESLVANPLSALFYPGNILFMVFPVAFGSSIYLLAHFLISAFGSYFLAREYKLSNRSSFATSIFYTFSIKTLLHLVAGHITMIAAISYFPTAFLSTRKIIKTDNKSFRWILLLAISISFQYILYATIFFYTIMFLALFVLYSTKIKHVLTKIVPLVSSGIIAFGLSAVAILPQLEYAKLSNRSSISIYDVATPIWNSKLFLEALLIPYLNFANLNHESFLYLGIAPLILSVIGFFYLKKKQKIIFLVFIIIALLFAAGLSAPLFKIAYRYIPFLKFSRVTTRFWFIISMLIALLAGFALDKLKKTVLTLAFIFLFLTESMVISNIKFEALPNLNFNNKNLYEFLANDSENFRIYCTSYCFNPQLVQKYNLELLNGESPIQEADFVNFLQRAGNYNYQPFAVIFPPYQVWRTKNPPSPNAYILGIANVKYIASTYTIDDPNLRTINKFENIYLYQNLLFKNRYQLSNLSTINLSEISPQKTTLNFPKISEPQDLIVSQKYLPGVNASAEGRRLSLAKNDIFYKISVPANAESVEIKYDPKSFKLGVGISILTIFLLSSYFWYTKRKLNG